MDMYDARRQPAHASSKPKPLVWGSTEAVRLVVCYTAVFSVVTPRSYCVTTLKTSTMRLGEGRNFEDVRTRNGRKGVRAIKTNRLLLYRSQKR